MNNRRGILQAGMAVFAGGLPLRAFAQSPPAAGQVLAAADAIRFPQRAFSAVNTLVEYVAGKPRDQLQLKVFSKLDPAAREFRTLVRYLAPRRDVGKLVLFNGANMWFFDPASKASVRISPQQRLIGQAANGDVVTANLADDYSPTISGPEKVGDADNKQIDSWRLDLKPKATGALYGRVELWVDRSNNRPVKGKFYAQTGNLLKLAYYRRYQNILDAVRPTQTIVIDAANPTRVTTMTLDGWTYEAIPETWFQRDYLPQIR